jgi:hypothetical protein
MKQATDILWKKARMKNVWWDESLEGKEVIIVHVKEYEGQPDEVSIRTFDSEYAQMCGFENVIVDESSDPPLDLARALCEAHPRTGSFDDLDNDGWEYDQDDWMIAAYILRDKFVGFPTKAVKR